MSDANKDLRPEVSEVEAPRDKGVVQVDGSDNQAGRGERGSSVDRAPQGRGGRQERSSVEAAGDHHREGSPPRISREGEVAAEELLAAFEVGDPTLAYDAALQLIDAHDRLMTEASAMRYRLNFGTPVCENCDGLKMSPGVVATCFQIRRCNYGNVKDGDVTPKQLRVLRRLETS